jgi:histidine ammonia-lyase
MAVLKSSYSLSEIIDLWKSEESVEIPQDILDGINASSAFMADFLAKREQPVYGVNTGFGSLQNVNIPGHELNELQRNLLITHAAGTGEFLPVHLVRLMLLLKIINISKGYSAVSIGVVNLLLFFYNNHLTPAVHEQGSLGASGDLAPLSEMVLPLIGLGQLHHKETGWMDTLDATEKFGFQALELGPKEALALINGTQFMLAHAIALAAGVIEIKDKLKKIAALSYDVFLCNLDPLLPALHRIRPHAGQIAAAAEILELLKDSPMQRVHRPAVQDQYSFRCIPQVHGASWDALDYCMQVWETELNSVTDNPTVFIEENAILSGGNFHGQALALTLDYAAMALAELGNISERRTYLLISGQRGLPPFLAINPGTDSGYMIAQYTAASIVSKNKQLCSPASVDSIVSSNGQEDHVSMGANAALKALQVLSNVKTVLAIEFLCGVQAFSFRNANTHPQIMSLFEHLQLVQDEHCYEPMNALIERSRSLLWDEKP